MQDFLNEEKIEKGKKREKEKRYTRNLLLR